MIATIKSKLFLPRSLDNVIGQSGRHNYCFIFYRERTDIGVVFQPATMNMRLINNFIINNTLDGFPKYAVHS